MRKAALTLLLLSLHACSSQGSVADSVAETGTDAAAAERTASPQLPFDWCEPNAPPDDNCHVEKRNPDSDSIALATAIANRYMDVHPVDSQAWNWEEAVLMLGLVELHRVTGDDVLLNYCRGWLDHHIAEGFEIATSDTCVPAAVAVYLHAATGKAEYAAVADDALDYLNQRALRTTEGGISHLGTVPVVTLWLDSLFMFGSVLTYRGEFASDNVSLDLFGEQFAIFTDLLQKGPGLYMHAYEWIAPQEAGVYWARGNGWVTAAAYQYLRVRRLREEEDGPVSAAASILTSAVLEVQEADTGLWWTVLNRPGETYLETSASALFAYSFARAYRYGYAGDDILAPIAAAMKGIRTRIETDETERPFVTGISGATGVDRFEGYAGIPQQDDLPFGVGAVLMALVETSGLPLEN